MNTEEIIKTIKNEMVCANSCPEYRSGNYNIHRCNCYKRDAIEGVEEIEEKANVFAVVKKLTGEIEPVAETHEDNRRFENLKVRIKLMDDIHTELDMIAYQNKDRHEDSIKRVVNYINKFFDKLGLPDE